MPTLVNILRLKVCDGYKVLLYPVKDKYFTLRVWDGKLWAIVIVDEIGLVY